MERLLYDRKAAAQQLSISVRSVGYYLARGEIQFRRVGRRVLIPHSALVKFAKADHFAPIHTRVVREFRNDSSKSVEDSSN
jgi:excisionase family DNA binding protein